MLRLTISSKAEADIRSARMWYENQRPGLGGEFELCLEAGFEHVRRNALVYRIIRGDVRRYLVKRFPYSIFYRIKSHTVIVIGVFHVKRNPTVWQDRID